MEVQTFAVAAAGDGAAPTPTDVVVTISAIVNAARFHHVRFTGSPSFFWQFALAPRGTIEDARRRSSRRHCFVHRHASKAHTRRMRGLNQGLSAVDRDLRPWCRHRFRRGRSLP
jgi:hypothetical protein